MQTVGDAVELIDPRVVTRPINLAERRHLLAPLLGHRAPHGGQCAGDGTEISAFHGREMLLLGVSALGDALLGEPEGKGEREHAVLVLADDVFDAPEFIPADTVEDDALFRLEGHLLAQRHVVEEDVARQPSLSLFDDLALLHLRHAGKGVVSFHQLTRPDLMTAQEHLARLVHRHRPAQSIHWTHLVARMSGRGKTNAGIRQATWLPEDSPGRRYGGETPRVESHIEMRGIPLGNKHLRPPPAQSGAGNQESANSCSRSTLAATNLSACPPP